MPVIFLFSSLSFLIIGDRSEQAFGVLFSIKCDSTPIKIVIGGKKYQIITQLSVITRETRIKTPPFLIVIAMELLPTMNVIDNLKFFFLGISDLYENSSVMLILVCFGLVIMKNFLRKLYHRKHVPEQKKNYRCSRIRNEWLVHR